LEIILKTYNDFFVAEHANQLHALETLGAEAKFVVQGYGTTAETSATGHSGGKFINIERRVELRVTMAGGWYALRWSRDSETLEAFDMARAASMAKRFVDDVDSLIPMLKERMRYIKVAREDIRQPIYQMEQTTVYRGSADNWDIQACSIQGGETRVADVLKPVMAEQTGISYVSQLKHLYRGSRITGTTKAMADTVMLESLVRTHIDHADRHVYEVKGFDGWQIMVSIDKVGVLFCPTYRGEELTERGAYPSLFRDGHCIFTAGWGQESLHTLWDSVGCTFEEFDAAQLLSDPVSVFRNFQRAPRKPAGAAMVSVDAAIA
jgi:hypothetical protein